MKRIILTALFFTSFFAAHAVPQYAVDFAKGNITEKIAATKSAGEANDAEFIFKVLDFAKRNHSIIGEDPELMELARVTASVVPERLSEEQRARASKKICSLFTEIKNPSVRLAAIEALYKFSTPDAVKMLNDFLANSMERDKEMDDVLMNTILFLGNKGNSQSFRILFLADILKVWPTYTEKLGNAWGNLAADSEKDILELVVSVPANKKNRILGRLNKNQKISENLRGKAAENALFSVIKNKGDQETYSKEELEFLMTAIRTVADTKWTRASKYSASCFAALKNAYENGNVGEQDFADSIRCIASVPSEETGKILSEYLDCLNKQTEKNSMPAKAVVLSVINSLGEMGNKNAFDFLLYVTYLSYPEDVVAAAKNALAKLKW